MLQQRPLPDRKLQVIKLVHQIVLKGNQRFCGLLLIRKENIEFENKLCWVLYKTTSSTLEKLGKLTSSRYDTGKDLFGVKDSIWLAKGKYGASRKIRKMKQLRKQKTNLQKQWKCTVEDEKPDFVLLYNDLKKRCHYVQWHIHRYEWWKENKRTQGSFWRNYKGLLRSCSLYWRVTLYHAWKKFGKRGYSLHVNFLFLWCWWFTITTQILPLQTYVVTWWIISSEKLNNSYSVVVYHHHHLHTQYMYVYIHECMYLCVYM